MDRWSAPQRCLFAVGCCAVLMVCCASCTKSPQPRTALEQEASKFAALPGLRGSSHPQLVSELQRIEGLQQTPLHLVTAETGKAYAPFVDAYPALSRPAIQRAANALWPDSSLRMEPGELQKARELLAQQAAARERFARAIDETASSAQLHVVDSLLTDDEWLEAIQTGCRLEGLAAADMLAEQEPDAAIQPLEKMLHVARQLARENNLNARLVAASLRADAAQVVHAIANHPAASLATLQNLQAHLLAQFTAWPSDERVWIAERAHGLLVYELARAGQFTALVTAEQLADMERKGIVQATATAALRNIDADQLFYLRAIQQQIEAAKLPYWQRQTAIEQLRTELLVRTDSGEYPLIAGSLLLNDVAAIHRTLAEDRTRCEAWLIVLTTICELPLGSPPPCPLTGQPYELQVDRERVKIAGLELRPYETIEVVRPGMIQARRRAAGFDLSQPGLR